MTIYYIDKTMHTAILFFILVMLIIFVRCDNNLEHAENVTNLSKEAIENIAGLYANTTGTAVFNNISATGNIIGSNIVGSLASSDKTKIMTLDNDGNVTFYDNGKKYHPNINGNIANGQYVTGVGLNGQFLYTNSGKTFNPYQKVLLNIQIGDTKAPITDLSGNTYRADQWTCKMLYGSNNMALGVRDGVWWVANSGAWNSWINATVEFTPIPLSIYYSSNYTTPNSRYITLDTPVPPSGWQVGPTNNGFNVVKPDGSGTYLSAPVQLLA